MPTTTIKFFTYSHLPPELQAIAKPIAELAEQMESTLIDSAEKSAGMRKLLEAKDCFVRAALDDQGVRLALQEQANAELQAREKQAEEQESGE